MEHNVIASLFELIAQSPFDIRLLLVDILVSGASGFSLVVKRVRSLKRRHKSTGWKSISRDD